MNVSRGDKVHVIYHHARAVFESEVNAFLAIADHIKDIQFQDYSTTDDVGGWTAFIIYRED